MGSPLNTVVSGLLGGFQLAHQLKGEQLAQAEFSEQKKRDEENAQVRDLATQMSLSDRGYKPSTPDQDAELMTGRGIGPIDIPGIAGGIQGPVASDIKQRTAKFKGQNYVREPDAVREGKARKLRTDVRDDKIAEETALASAKGEAETGVLKRRMELLGVPLTDEAATRYGVPKGTKLLQGPGFGTELGALMRGANANGPDANDPVTRSYLTRENGGSVVTVHKSGKVQVSDTLGLPAEDKKKTLSPFQQIQVDRQKKADAEKNTARLAEHEAAQKTISDHEAEIKRLNADEQNLHQGNISIGNALKAGKTPDGKKVTAKDAADYHAKLKKNATQISALQAKQAMHKQAQNAVLMRFAGRTAMAGYGAAPDDGEEEAADTGADAAASPAGLENPYRQQGAR